MSFVPQIDWAAVPRQREHRQLGERPRWFNGAPVTSIAIDPRGRHLLTAGNRFLRLYWAASGELVHTFEGGGNEGTVYDRAGFSPDGRRVLAHLGPARGDDGALGVWDVETGALEKRIEDPPVGRISAVDPRRARVLARGHDAGALLLDAEDGSARVLLPRPDGGLGGSAFVGDARVIGMASMGSTVRCWDTATGALVWGQSIADRSSAVAAPRDADWIAFGGATGDVSVHDAATGAKRFSLTAAAQGDRDGWTTSLDATPDGRRVLAVSKREAHVWDVVTRAVLIRLSPDADSTGAISPDGRFAFLGDIEGRLTRIAIDGGAPDQVVSSGNAHAAAIRRVGFDESGRPLSCDASNIALRWSPAPVPHEGGMPDPPTLPAWARAKETAISERIQSRHRDDVEYVETMIANDEIAVTLSSWGGVEIWGRDANPRHDLNIGSEKGSLTFGGAKVIALHPDGRRLALGTTRPDTPIQIWDALTGKPTLVLEGHEATVRALAFHPDGSSLLSGGDDRVARLWSLK